MKGVPLVKKVVSIALSEESVIQLDETSKALGWSKSELVDYMITKGWNFPDEVMETLELIKNLQKQNKGLKET